MAELKKTATLADQTYAELEKRILTGVYAPGSMIKEVNLSQELGVSRTPIREAIRRLEAEGLVQETAAGVEILGVTDQDLYDICEIRQCLEGLAARKAAGRITPEQLQQLQEIIELQEFYIARGNADQIKNTDSSFHTAIYACCGSAVLQDMLTTLHKRIQKYRMLSVQNREHAAQVAAEHCRIYEALAAHDPQQAEKMAEEHAKNARRRAIGGHHGLNLN